MKFSSLICHCRGVRDPNSRRSGAQGPPPASLCTLHSTTLHPRQQKYSINSRAQGLPNSCTAVWRKQLERNTHANAHLRSSLKFFTKMMVWELWLKTSRFPTETLPSANELSNHDIEKSWPHAADGSGVWSEKEVLAVVAGFFTHTHLLHMTPGWGTSPGCRSRYPAGMAHPGIGQKRPRGLCCQCQRQPLPGTATARRLWFPRQPSRCILTSYPAVEWSDLPPSSFWL